MKPVEPPDRDSLDEPTRTLVDLSGVRNGGTPLAIIDVLAHRPTLVEPFMVWSAALAVASALGARRHEIAALRASWHCGSHYEWGNHARYAIEAGLTEIELAMIGDRDGALQMEDPADAVVMDLVDEMIEGGPTPSRDRAVELLGTPALVDLVWTVGQYVGLSLVAETLALPVGDDLAAVPPRSPRSGNRVRGEN